MRKLRITKHQKDVLNKLYWGGVIIELEFPIEYSLEDKDGNVYSLKSNTFNKLLSIGLIEKAISRSFFCMTYRLSDKGVEYVEYIDIKRLRKLANKIKTNESKIN